MEIVTLSQLTNLFEIFHYFCFISKLIYLGVDVGTGKLAAFFFSNVSFTTWYNFNTVGCSTRWQAVDDANAWDDLKSKGGEMH